MVPLDSPIVALAQQGVEAAGNIVAMAPTAENHRDEPSGGNRSHDRAKRTRSEVASLVSSNRHLADNDVQQRITQNRQYQEYGHDRANLCNIIDDRRRYRARSPSPPQHSLE
jgi:hypothetical protein